MSLSDSHESNSQAQNQLPLKCVNTANLPQLLSQLGISLVVSTYQAGKLILVRADGTGLNAHFRQFQRPMGLAVNQMRMAVGTKYQIVELYNMPAVAQKLDPPGKHDACYLQRNVHVTGDIDVHEMAWAGEELWLVNTRFSCLCTVEPAHSFNPRWRPPFVSALSPDDRCHLNGLAVVGDRPKYVTALGQTNTAQGWRESKAYGGVLMDIETNDFVTKGLSMPHSPRWYDNKLWVLESGQGSVATVDLQTGQLTTIVQLPGFTRGLAFYGPLAFIGLSRVRETAIFSGIPLTERLTERTCGVWIVNTQTRETVAFLRFESGVEEVFAVGVMPNIRFPEVLDSDEERLASSYSLPDEALKDVAV